MNPLAAALAAALVVGGLVWSGLWGLSACRPLDRLFGLSGCADSFTISDLTDLRRTVAFHPGEPSTLVVAGSSYSASSSSETDRLRVSSTVVLYDLNAGRETVRYGVPPTGVIEQLVLSSDGTRAALTCNRSWTCEFDSSYLPEDGRPDDSLSRYVPVSLIDLVSPPSRAQATVPWLRVIREAEVPPNADGMAVDLRFSADGASLIAFHDGSASVAWSVEDGSAIVPSAEPGDSLVGFDAVATADGATRVTADRQAGLLRLTGTAADVGMLALDLPEGFIGELHMPLAVSPDGSHVAALSRRFAGPGAPRAILQVWRLADGARVARHEIEEDLHATLVWHPDGRQVLVAPASKPAVEVGTELRLYMIGEWGAQ